MCIFSLQRGEKDPCNAKASTNNIKRKISDVKKACAYVWRGEMVKYHAMVQMLLFEHFFYFQFKESTVIQCY